MVKMVKTGENFPRYECRHARPRHGKKMGSNLPEQKPPGVPRAKSQITLRVKAIKISGRDCARSGQPSHPPLVICCEMLPGRESPFDILMPGAWVVSPGAPGGLMDAPADWTAPDGRCIDRRVSARTTRMIVSR